MFTSLTNLFVWAEFLLSIITLRLLITIILDCHMITHAKWDFIKYFLILVILITFFIILKIYNWIRTGYFAIDFMIKTIWNQFVDLLIKLTWNSLLLLVWLERLRIYCWPKLFILFVLVRVRKIYIVMDHFNLISCLIKTMFARAHHQETFLF